MQQFKPYAFAATATQPLTNSHGHAFGFPQDTCVVAIGDVHGQALGFERALDGVAQMLPNDKRCVLVLTGDLIDRGPESLRCIHLGATAAHYGFAQVVRLPGNHELLMLDALEDMEAMRTGDPRSYTTAIWLDNGGRRVVDEVMDGDEPWEIFPINWPLIAQKITAALGEIEGVPYRQAMRAAPSHARVGDVLFVHAGIDPREPYEQALARPQAQHLDMGPAPHTPAHHDSHWAWVRYPFLDHTKGFVDAHNTPLLVVHGHTMAAGADISWLWEPDRTLVTGMDERLAHGRICIDAAAARATMVGGAIFDSSGYRLFASPCR